MAGRVRTFDLPADHPGFTDPAYRARRAAIAAVGESYRPGDPIPDVEYSPEENEVWRIVSTELAEKHCRYACSEYLAGAHALRLPVARVPQLREVDERIHALTEVDRGMEELLVGRCVYGPLATKLNPTHEVVFPRRGSCS